MFHVLMVYKFPESTNIRFRRFVQQQNNLRTKRKYLGSIDTLKGLHLFKRLYQMKTYPGQI